MARFFLLITGYFITALATGQRATMPKQMSHYVLDSFTQGKVQMKTGLSSEQSLNYNILTGEMIFTSGGRMLAIEDPKGVDTVFVSNRKFIPADKQFYEVLTQTSAPLLLGFTFKIDQPPVSVGYGDASQASNATSLTSLVRGGQAYEIKLPDDFKVIPGYTYLVRKEGQDHKFANAKQLDGIFPEKKDFINGYVKQHKTDFTRREELIELVQQLEH